MNAASEGWGQPTPTLYEHLGELGAAVRIAWLEAQAYPARADEILEDLVKRVNHTGAIARLHLKGAVERATARGNAADKATIQAEARVRRGLAVLAESIREDGFDVNGFFVYCLWPECGDKPLYVGQSTNVLSRLGSHMNDPSRRHRIHRVTLIRCKSARHMNDTEWRLIKEYQPELNQVGIAAAIEFETNPIRATPPFGRAIRTRNRKRREAAA